MHGFFGIPDKHSTCFCSFIADFEGDLYGETPYVEFYAYLAPSRKFAALEQLKACIEDAAQQAKSYFSC